VKLTRFAGFFEELFGYLSEPGFIGFDGLRDDCRRAI